MKTIALFGGSGGLGRQLEALLNKNPEIEGENVGLLKYQYSVTPLSSKDVDISEEGQVKDFFQDTNFDVVINAAARNMDGMIHKISDEQVSYVVNNNIRGLINIFKYAIPMMRNNDYGRIITFSSILGKRPLRGTSLYSASKAFMDNLVKTTALENAKYGITVNSINLGYFDGGLTYTVPEKVLESELKRVPLGRLGRVDELYRCVDFLIKTEYITGTNIDLSGGLQI